MAHVVRRSVRAIVIDEEARLLVIRRTKPGSAPYWTLPGGAIEETDNSPVAALRRGLHAELGATADVGEEVFVYAAPIAGGVTVEHFMACRLSSRSRGRGAATEPERVPLEDGSLEAVDLRPAAVKDFILANREALQAAATGPSPD